MRSAQKLNLPVPAEPLYLLKAPNSYLAPGETIRKPLCDGKVVFEGELGIVIGKTCTAVPEAQALDHVFGYTCANDVTVADILNRDASFAQWIAPRASTPSARWARWSPPASIPSTLTVTTRARWRGAPELSDQRHALFGAAAGQPDLVRHDAASAAT